jgi:predicted Zn-dependent peptidase
MDIKSRGVLEVVDKQLEQAHLLFATNGLEIDDSRRHQLSILNLILGGGVSSRLFQTIREQRGLAYTIYSFYDQYSEGGMFGVYAACAVSALRELWGVSRSEILKLIEDGPTEKEVERAKLQSSGNIKMSMESPNTRISQIAYQLHYFGEIITEKVMIDNVMSVTADQVRQLGRALWTEEKHYTKVALGPLCEKEVSFLS